MLFGKRERLIRRILIVEDEPLVAFDNEHTLRDAGYEVVATVDSYADAAEVIESQALDLVITDIGLSGDGDGADVARAAEAKGVPTLFVTAKSLHGEKALALGCLTKPYSAGMLEDALAAIDRHLQGRTPKRLPRGLELYEASNSSS